MSVCCSTEVLNQCGTVCVGVDCGAQSTHCVYSVQCTHDVWTDVVAWGVARHVRPRYRPILLAGQVKDASQQVRKGVQQQTVDSICD